MNFPGDNYISLSTEAMRHAIEDALNSTRMEGEDRIYALSFTRDDYGNWKVKITTDKPAPVELTPIAEAA